VAINKSYYIIYVSLLLLLMILRYTIQDLSFDMGHARIKHPLNASLLGN